MEDAKDVAVGVTNCFSCMRATTWFKDKQNILKCYSCGMSMDEGKQKSSSDKVNHPKHYNSHPAGIECIDVVEHMTFNRGNAIKYIWRAGMKGDIIEDLKKAIWYVEREIKKIEKEKAKVQT